MTLRSIQASNAGPFTLEGTRTFLVGTRRVAVVDPGPDDPGHVRAVAGVVAGAEAVTLVLTHGHADHAGAAPALASLLDAPVVGAWGTGPGEPGEDRHPGPAAGLSFRALGQGEVVPTDAGALVAVHTPGHTPDHLAFHWEAGRALLAGDLLLGRGDTTWVAGYPGCVTDYLASLERVSALPLDIIHPAHGPDLDDPAAALERFESHRRVRVRQVRDALAEAPGADEAELLARVYGDAIPPGLRGAALESLRALVEHVRGPAG
ncbi:MAG: MBL fold metallo-hydrolase [Gemmatimonadetes bacterium]|nr:MBL fold metallo-hydrolase [Gemmatimonadota bacterium]